MTTTQEHWESVYWEKDPTAVSWFEPAPELSLRLIDRLELDRRAPIVDVGGGGKSVV